MINYKKQRFYWFNLTQDLFDNWCLHTVFGGLNSKVINSHYVLYENKLAASQAMFDNEILRRKQGYIYADTFTADDYILTPEIIEQ
jgi:hypothetical protein